jgi:hypothetical protein
LAYWGIAARCRQAQRTDPLGHEIHRQRELGVLLLEHEMQRVEHRTGDVPVEVVRLEVERVGVDQNTRQPLGDRFPVRILDADVDLFHEMRSPFCGPAIADDARYVTLISCFKTTCFKIIWNNSRSIGTFHEDGRRRQ